MATMSDTSAQILALSKRIEALDAQIDLLIRSVEHILEAMGAEVMAEIEVDVEDMMPVGDQPDVSPAMMAALRAQSHYGKN